LILVFTFNLNPRFTTLLAYFETNLFLNAVFLQKYS
jgi:hypothetical protein